MGQESNLAPAEWIERSNTDLLVAPKAYLSQEHPSIVLFKEDYVCVTWAESPQFIHGLDFRTYIDAGHVVTYFAGGRSPAADTWLLQQSGIVRRVEVVAPSLLAPTELVVGTDRIATVHRRLAERAARHLPLRLWDLPVEVPQLIEHLQWNRAREDDPAMRWMISACREIGSRV